VEELTRVGDEQEDVQEKWRVTLPGFVCGTGKVQPVEPTRSRAYERGSKSTQVPPP